MGKTIKKQPKDNSQVTKLKLKLADRKEQILRLKRIIKESQKKLEKYEKGVVLDKGKPLPKKRLTEVEKKANSKKEFMDKLNKQFIKKEIEYDVSPINDEDLKVEDED